jgi:hypothetical protein
MKPVVSLRIASVLTFFHAVAHTIGGVFGKAAPGIQAATVATMKANTFPMMGVTRSYWDFQRGFGLAVTIFLTIEAIVFWQLASLAKSDAARLRPIIAVFAAGYVLMAVNSYEYFFAAPVVTEVLIALFLILAIATARSTARAAS